MTQKIIVTTPTNSGNGTPLNTAFDYINDNFTELYASITPVPYANLGTAVAGSRAFVNNGNLSASGHFGSQIGGGGSNVVPVWSDGTNWYVG